jgi:hypothetical protein
MILEDDIPRPLSFISISDLGHRISRSQNKNVILASILTKKNSEKAQHSISQNIKFVELL